MNHHFRTKARTKERAFLRKFGKEGFTFFTVKEQRPNVIQKVTKDFIYITTERAKSLTVYHGRACGARWPFSSIGA